MLLKTFMEIVDYRITEGSDYSWQCYGPNAYQLDSWNGEQDGHSLCILFDTKTQVVYEVQAHDYANSRAYRMIHPDYVTAHKNECEDRGCIDQAWEDDSGNPIEYVDLEVEEDFEEKACAIVAGLDYDTMVSVPLDLPDDLLLEAALNAHKQDITLNAYINNALREMMEEYKHDPASVKARVDLWKAKNDLA